MLSAKSKWSAFRDRIGSDRALLRRLVLTELLEPRQFLSGVTSKTPGFALSTPAILFAVPDTAARNFNPHAAPAALLSPDDDDDDGGDIESDDLPVNGQTDPVGAVSPALPVTGGSWIFGGPAPILNGQISGSGAVSGRITSIAPSLTDANTIYIGSAGGGVWKTTNGGTSWTALTDGQPNEAIGAVAIAPSSPNTIYAGTGEASNSGDSQYGDGVLKSTDGGNTWTLLGTSYFNRNTFLKSWSIR